MDIDQYLKSSATPDQTDLMMTMMMMQMDNLPKFHDVDQTSTDHDLLSMSFPGSGGDTAPQTLTSTNRTHQPPHPPCSSSGAAASPSNPPWGATGDSSSSGLCPNNGSMAAMREMIFRMAVMQPVHIDPESVKPPKRRNVKISKDPQSVAARHRRERISERIRILQRLVPGGTKMDTASMLDEAIHYVKFLKTQVQSLERVAVNHALPPPPQPGLPGAGVGLGLGFPVAMNNGSVTNNYLPMAKANYH